MCELCISSIVVRFGLHLGDNLGSFGARPGDLDGADPVLARGMPQATGFFLASWYTALYPILYYEYLERSLYRHNIDAEAHGRQRSRPLVGVSGAPVDHGCPRGFRSNTARDSVACGAPCGICSTRTRDLRSISSAIFRYTDETAVDLNGDDENRAWMC